MFKLKDKFKDCLMSISNFDCNSATILEQNWKKSQTTFCCQKKKEDLSGISENSD